MANTIEARVKQKKDTLANWEANPMIILDGEQAFVVNGSGQPINFKIGDGTKRFSELPYWIQYDQAVFIPVSGLALPTPTQPVGYSLLGEGTYTHASGGFTVPAGHWGVANWDGSAWSFSDMGDLPASVADGVVQKGDDKATSGNEVFKESRLINDRIGKLSGGEFYPIFVKGGLDASGNEVVYTTEQPRMRTGFVKLQKAELLISSLNDFEFHVFVYDNAKKFRYSTTASGQWNTSFTIGRDKGYFRIIARKRVAPFPLSDSDLLSDIRINSYDYSLNNSVGLDKIENSIGTKSYTVSWLQGTINDTTEEISSAFNNAITSTLYRMSGKKFTVKVGSGFRARLRIYSSVATNKETLISSYANAEEHTVELDNSYYVRIIVSSDNPLAPANVGTVGLVTTGLESTFTDIRHLPFAQKVTNPIVSYQNGYYDYNNKTFISTLDKKSFLYTAGATNAYINISVNPDFFINYSIWNGNTLVETVTFRPYISLYLKKGQDITVAIGKRDFSNYNGSEVIGMKFNRVDEKMETVAFINLNSKIHKGNFNADEYGLRLDNSDNSDALNNLIEYLYNHGGGKIVLPIGILDFAKRVEVKSFIDIVGYGKGKSVMRMVGNTYAFSLLDNMNTLITNCNYRDFTIDGYDYNPSVPYTSDMKAMNFHHVKDCDFSNLEIKGSPASGIGIDYLYNVVVSMNHVIECGRLWLNNGAANMQGGSGIGIGTGGGIDENFFVMMNVVEKCGQNGIFIEDQGIFSGANTPPGMGNIISNNISRNNRKNGLSARGNTRCTFDSNIVYSNAENGFLADKYLREIKLTNNQFFNNPNGVKITHGDTRQSYDVDITSNLIKDSTLLGLSLTGIPNNGSTSRFNIESNKIFGSPIGLQLAGTSNDWFVRANKVRNISGNALDISGSHANMVFEDNSIRGTVSNTATFTGDTSENELV